MSANEQAKPGWVVDETGALRRETRHRMGRRCRNWDYRGRGVYLITIAAAERGRGVWGRVVAEPASGSARTGGTEPASGSARTEGAGSAREGGSARAGGVGAAPLAVRFEPNGLGEIIANQWAYLAEAWPGVRLLAAQVMEDHFHGVIATPSFMEKPLGAIIGSFKARASSEAGRSLWAKGYVDTILFDDEAVEKGVRYVETNPWRLAVKREHPELFKVTRERGLARQAFEAGAKVITLQNKGFSPFYKPGGRLFEPCAEGRLLMLAPAAWPYLPGEKPITRASACTLNRIAQMIAGAGAAAINYRGMKVDDVDRLVAEALK